jgi:hypothetical protein
MGERRVFLQEFIEREGEREGKLLLQPLQFWDVGSASILLYRTERLE